MARCMVKSQLLPNGFWLEAVMCAAYILKRCPTKALRSITPYEAWHGRKPSIGHLRVFDCLAYVLVPMQQRQKLDDKAEKCIFLGYSLEHKGYRCYNPITRKLKISRDVVFDELASLYALPPTVVDDGKPTENVISLSLASWQACCGANFSSFFLR